MASSPRAPFVVHPRREHVVQIPESLVPPIQGYGKLIARQTSVVPREEVPRLVHPDAVAFENVRIEFPLDFISGAAAVENDHNWGVGPEGIDAAAFWEAGARGERVRFGIADSGVDVGHPAFSRMRAERRLVGFARFDKQGRKMVTHREDGSAMTDAEVEPSFTHWHGTHCAAILAGEPTEGKLRGAAPAAELAVACVLEQSNVGTVAGITGGLWWLADQACDIVSLSLGWPGKHEEWAEAIQEMLRRGTVVVAAVGNEFAVPGVEPSRSPANYPFSPKSDAEGLLLAVGAHDKHGRVWEDSGGEIADWRAVVVKGTDGAARRSRFADAPPTAVPSLIAPGVDIVSAIPGGRYLSSEGSSMATPHIAGQIGLVLSLLRQKNANASPREAAERLFECVAGAADAGDATRAGRGRALSRPLVARIRMG